VPQNSFLAISLLTIKDEMSDSSSSAAPAETVMEVEELVDEYVLAFEAAEAANDQSPSAWESLLAEPRVDESATKIKEKCIYKLAKLHADVSATM